LNRNRQLSKKKELLYTKLGIVGFTLVAVTLAIFYPRMADNIIVYVSIGIGLSPLVVISWLSREPDVRSMIISFIVTSLTVIVLVIGFDYIHPGLGFVAILECFALYFIIFGIRKILVSKK
jgi:Na+/proline symporter